MESQAILPQEQMGFRLNRLCTNSLVTLTNNIQTSFLVNEVVAAAFLDITGAFDNVLPEAVLSETQKIRVSARLRKFIENITHRRIHFEEDYLSEAYSVHKGTPQGSTQLAIFQH